MHPSRKITLAVLAGGMGSRMGRAKAALQIQGKTVLSYLIGRLKWSGPTMLVTAPGRTAPAGAELFDVEAVDPVEGQGPLRGILAALESADSDVIVITVDMPAITPVMLAHLTEFMDERPALLGLMFHRLLSSEESVEPFPCYVRGSARDPISKAIEEGRRSVRGLLRDSRFGTLNAPADWPNSVWTNLNTPEDLAAFEKTLAGGDKM